jgi:hypothetical protein
LIASAVGSRAERELLAIPDSRYQEINTLMSDVLAYLVER